ncbi:MAG: HAD hydrolase-like protein [Candidatus Shapirobacteria bacterium]|jgi:phosphoglycolate phosphatase-like HAD superfamily hydrolase
MDNKISIKPLIIFDLQGTLVKRMRPPLLNGSVIKLKKLSQLNTLAIFTGASKTETINILKKLGIYDLFIPKNIITKGIFPQKPSPLAIKWLIEFNLAVTVTYVGDTNKDYLTAKNSVVSFISVGFKKPGITQISTVDDLLNVKINL